MPATVYERVCLKKNDFSRKDLRRIANWINSIYKKDNESDPPKVEQKEGEQTFLVYSYPDELIPVMDSVVDKFFKNKDHVADKHNQYLDEMKKCKEEGKPIKPPQKVKPLFGKGSERPAKFGQNKDFKKPFSKDKKFGGDKPFNRDKSGFQNKPFKKDFAKDKFEQKGAVADAKPSVRQELPVATTLRKRKTAPGAVLPEIKK